MTRRLVLRARRSCVAHGRVLVVALLLVGLLSLGSAGWLLTAPGHETVTVTTDERAVRTDVTASARVTGDTSLYPHGTRLTNESVFLRSATDRVSFDVVTSTGGNATVEQRLVLVVQAVRDDAVFWESRRTLARQRTTTDGRAVVRGTLDLDRLVDRLERVRTELGAVGTLRVRLRAVTTYETAQYAGRLVDATTLGTSDRAVWLADDLSASRSHATRTARTVPRDPDPLRVGGLAAAGLVSLGLAAVVRREAMAGNDPQRLAERLAVDRNREWISTGRLPHALGRTTVPLDSIQDLVDLGIDTNRRVIEDPERGVYAVLAEDVVYYYATGTDGDRGAYEAGTAVYDERAEERDGEGDGETNGNGVVRDEEIDWVVCE